MKHFLTISLLLFSFCSMAQTDTCNHIYVEKVVIKAETGASDCWARWGKEVVCIKCRTIKFIERVKPNWPKIIDSTGRKVKKDGPEGDRL